MGDTPQGGKNEAPQQASSGTDASPSRADGTPKSGGGANGAGADRARSGGANKGGVTRQQQSRGSSRAPDAAAINIAEARSNPFGTVTQAPGGVIATTPDAADVRTS